MDKNPMSVALLQTTIREAYEGFSKGKVKGAILTREAQASEKDMSDVSNGKQSHWCN
jgi:hypothetical protein